MKVQILFVICCCLFLSCMPVSGQADVKDVVDTITGGGTGGGLGDETIVKGLLEALEIGTGNAITGVSRMDGYLANEAIKILLPEDVQKAEKLIRMAGGGDKLDAFVVSMNRAAEQAAPEARQLFTEAIGEMTFEDARKILNGRENEATLFFQDKMSVNLAGKFEPKVVDVLNKSDVTKQYKEIEGIMSTLPLKGKKDFNLEKYVTGKALDGLFLTLAAEEKKIRQDPAARVTDTLKTVFGGGK